MKKREIGNLFLHIGVGGALTALALWKPWLILLMVFVFAFLREQAQHRYILKQANNLAVSVGGLREKPKYYVEKRTFFDFGWLGVHQMFEILEWVIGAQVALVLWTVFK